MINDYTQYVSGDEFLSKNAEVKTAERDFDYHSFYRAYVVDNNDPEKLGRVKIQIPAKHPNNTTYPWAYPACFTGLGFQTGMFILPPVGSIVFVTFEYSDEHRPIYFGGVPTRYAEGKTQYYGPFINNGMSKLVSDDDLPTEYTGTQQIVYKAPNGSILYFDSSDKNNLIVLKNMYEMQFKIGATYDPITQGTDREIEMYFNDRNYFVIKENEVHLVINGEEIDIGGSGPTPTSTAKTIIWDTQVSENYYSQQEVDTMLNGIANNLSRI